MDEKRFCPYCGESLKGKEIFCGKCGKQVASTGGKSVQENAVNQHKGIGKIFILLIIVAVCGVVGFMVYNSTDQKQIIGSWIVIDEDGEYTGEGMAFYDDGRIVDMESGLVGNYVLDDGQLMVSYNSGGREIVEFIAEYEIKGNRLTLTLEDDGDQINMVRSEANFL